MPMNSPFARPSTSGCKDHHQTWLSSLVKKDSCSDSEDGSTRISDGIATGRSTWKSSSGDWIRKPLGTEEVPVEHLLGRVLAGARHCTGGFAAI